MKRSAALLLALLLLVSAAFADGGTASSSKEIGSTADAPTIPGDTALPGSRNYMNAHIEVLPWPEVPAGAIAVFYADDKCLLVPRSPAEIIFALYDVSTGDMTPLRPDDDDAWRALIDAELQRGNPAFTPEKAAGMIEAEGLLSTFYQIAGHSAYVQRSTVAGSHIFLQSGSYIFIVDTVHATIRSIDAQRVQPDGRWINWPTSAVSYTVNAPDGSSVSGSFEGDPGYEPALSAVVFSDDEAACVVRGLLLNMKGPNPYAVGFRQGCEGAGSTSFVGIGSYKAVSGPDSVLIWGDRILAYSLRFATVFPALLADPDEGTACALFSEGAVISTLTLEECTNADGFMTTPKGMSSIIPLGVSADGRYLAAIEFDSSDVIVIDAVTLEAKVLLDAEAAAEKGVQPLFHLTHWDGSDFINVRTGYTLKFVFD